MVLLRSLGDMKYHQEIADRKTMQHQIDEDGFQTVVNPKRKIPMDLDRLPKKQKSKELQDFYRFQLREKKRNRTLHIFIITSFA